MSCSRNPDTVNANFLPFIGEKPSNLSPLTGDLGGNSSQRPTMLNSLSRAFEVIGIWRERVRGRRALLNLNDHLLRDIGITRLDVTIESTKSFWRP